MSISETWFFIFLFSNIKIFEVRIRQTMRIDFTEENPEFKHVLSHGPRKYITLMSNVRGRKYQTITQLGQVQGALASTFWDRKDYLGYISCSCLD